MTHIRHAAPFLAAAAVVIAMISADPAGQVPPSLTGPCVTSPALFRSEADCIMFTRDEVGFCRVCRRAIERIIDLCAR